MHWLVLVLLQQNASFETEIQAAIKDVERVYAVPSSLVKAVIKQESAFNPRALSSCGAIGLMQVMPENATRLGLASSKELWVPKLNILAGVRLLAALLHHYEGDVMASLVAYNSGPKAKLALPENGETPEYVAHILRYWAEYRKTEAH